jgi:predicted membrane-bound spermidine synthase
VLIISGFTTMAYEIIWMRAAKYLVGNSIYAVSIVLAIFLVGLGLGGTAHRPLIRRFRPDQILMVSQAATGILALITISLIGYCVVDSSIANDISMFADSVRFLAWPSRLAITVIVATALFLPVTTIMGLTFPLASTLYVERMATMGKRLGNAYLLSHLGCISGVVIGAHLILPGFGTMDGTKVISGVNMLLALALLALLWRWLYQSRAIMILGAGTALALRVSVSQYCALTLAILR